jgi:hypothetical protein
MKKYAISYADELYSGDYDTIEEAAHEVEPGRAVWIGEKRAPVQPETLWDVEDWLERVSDDDDYFGEWAEDWDASTRKQVDELEAEVRAVMAAWLDRHNLRPKFFVAENAVYYSAERLAELREKGESE